MWGLWSCGQTQKSPTAESPGSILMWVIEIQDAPPCSQNISSQCVYTHIFMKGHLYGIKSILKPKITLEMRLNIKLYHTEFIPTKFLFL